MKNKVGRPPLGERKRKNLTIRINPVILKQAKEFFGKKRRLSIIIENLLKEVIK